MLVKVQMHHAARISLDVLTRRNRIAVDHSWDGLTKHLKRVAYDSIDTRWICDFGSDEQVLSLYRTRTISFINLVLMSLSPCIPRQIGSSRENPMDGSMPCWPEAFPARLVSA